MTATNNLYFDKNITACGGTGYAVDLHTALSSSPKVNLVHNVVQQCTTIDYATATFSANVTIYESENTIF